MCLSSFSKPWGVFTNGDPLMNILADKLTENGVFDFHSDLSPSLLTPWLSNRTVSFWRRGEQSLHQLIWKLLSPSVECSGRASFSNQGESWLRSFLSAAGEAGEFRNAAAGRAAQPPGCVPTSPCSPRSMKAIWGGHTPHFHKEGNGNATSPERGRTQSQFKNRGVRRSPKSRYEGGPPIT